MFDNKKFVLKRVKYIKNKKVQIIIIVIIIYYSLLDVYNRYGIHSEMEIATSFNSNNHTKKPVLNQFLTL